MAENNKFNHNLITRLYNVSQQGEIMFPLPGRKFFTVFFLFLQFTLTAQTVQDSLPQYNLNDSIVVIANRYQVSMKNISDSYEVIPGEQINAFSSHSALELVDLNYPSSFVMDKRTMGYGVGPDGAGQVNLRGQGGRPNTGVLVLLNGHPDFMGIFGHPLPDVYGVDDIQQIEVLAGPNSTVFGDHAMGGVINIVTQPDYNHFIKISAEGGSYNTYNLGLNLTKQIGRSGLFFNVRKKQSDGHIDNTSFESLNLQAGWAYQFNPVWSLALNGRYVPYSFDDPARAGLEDKAELGTYAKIKRGTGEIIVKNMYDKLHGSTQLYTNLGEHRFYDGFESNDYTFGFSSYQNWLYSDNLTFAGGLDIINYGGKAKNDFAKLPNGAPIVNPDEHQLTSYGLYLLGFYSPLQILHIKAGLRYQYDTEPLKDRLSPVIGLAVIPIQSLKLFANYQNGYRNPTLMELYLFPSANDQLKEESINSFEGGASFSWHDHNSFKISYYNNNVDNMIQSLPNATPPPPYRFMNSGSAAQWGIEAKLNMMLIKNSGVMLSYSYLDPDHITAYNPKHQIKYILFSNYRKFSLKIYGKYIQDLYASNNWKDPLNDYNLLNLYISYNLKSVKFYFKGLNLLNRNYDILPGYEAPGFQARLGTVIKL